jgi:hypothetical protein
MEGPTEKARPAAPGPVRSCRTRPTRRARAEGDPDDETRDPGQLNQTAELLGARGVASVDDGWAVAKATGTGMQACPQGTVRRNMIRAPCGRPLSLEFHDDARSGKACAKGETRAPMNSLESSSRPWKHGA